MLKENALEMIKNRITEYEKLEKEFTGADLTTHNINALMNIRHELVFLRSLITE